MAKLPLEVFFVFFLGQIMGRQITSPCSPHNAAFTLDDPMSSAMMARWQLFDSDSDSMMVAALQRYHKALQPHSHSINGELTVDAT